MNIVISGGWSYAIEPSSGTVNLTAGLIKNLSSTYTTANIRLELWLTTDPWNPSGNTGYKITAYQLPLNLATQISLSQGISNISSSSKYLYNPPPAGKYFVTLCVAEYSGDSPNIDDGYVVDYQSVANNLLLVDGNGNLSLGTSAVSPISNALIFDLRVGSVVATPNQVVKFSDIFILNTSSQLPTYLDITLFDRNEYPKGIQPQLGYFLGNSNKYFLSNTYADHYGAGIIFTYQSSSGQYYNSKYGYLNQLQYVTSPSQYDSTYMTIVGSNSLDVLLNTSIKGTTFSISQDVPVLSYNASTNQTPIYGSVDIVTRVSNTSYVPIQATPNSIVNTANAFNGVVWNKDGCWVLVSNIASISGCSLPISSASFDSSSLPQNNGEWIVVYNGATQSNPSIKSAENLLLPGDVLATNWSLTGPDAGGGHITTIVSGSGITSVVMDNIQITGNGSNIVDSYDVKIQSHSLDESLTYNQAVPSSIVIYRLDTPTIKSNQGNFNIISGSSIKLAPLFSTTDAGGAGSLPITEYSFYSVGTGSAQNDCFLLNGISKSAISASNALIIPANNLSNISLQSYAGNGGTDTIYVQAFNGSYWGDWVPVNILEAPSVVSLPATVSSITLQPNTTYTALANQTIKGLSGVNTVIINGAYTNFSITEVSSTVTLKDKVGTLGTEILSNIQRIKFSDGTALALDFQSGQSSFNAVMMIGTAFGSSFIPTYFSAALSIYDQGQTNTQVAPIIEQAGLIESQLKISTTNTPADNKAWVDFVYKNVVGSLPDLLSEAVYTSYLANGTYTRAQILTLATNAADSGVGNIASQINLTGLQMNGLVYKSTF
jgi:hypothetical protein